MGGEDGKRERQKEYGKARALESWRGHKSVWERGREACPGIQAGKHCASRSKHSTELSASCPKSYGRHHRAARKAERVRETSRARPRRLDGLAPAPRPLPRPAACGRKRGGSRPCLPLCQPGRRRHPHENAAGTLVGTEPEGAGGGQAARPGRRRRAPGNAVELAAGHGGREAQGQHAADAWQVRHCHILAGAPVSSKLPVDALQVWAEPRT